MFLMGHLWSEILSLLTPQLPENRRPADRFIRGRASPHCAGPIGSIWSHRAHPKQEPDHGHIRSHPLTPRFPELLIPIAEFAYAAKPKGACSEDGWK